MSAFTLKLPQAEGDYNVGAEQSFRGRVNPSLSLCPFLFGGFSRLLFLTPDFRSAAQAVLQRVGLSRCLNQVSGVLDS